MSLPWVVAHAALLRWMLCPELSQGIGLGKKAIDAAADLLDFLGILQGGPDESQSENGTATSNAEAFKSLQRFTPEEWLQKVQPVVSPLYVSAELLPGSIR